MTYQLLTLEQMRAVATDRLLQSEASHYNRTLERATSAALGDEASVKSHDEALALLQVAIDNLSKELAGLESLIAQGNPAEVSA